MSRVLVEVPTLARHACVNERGTVFAAVMDCTPLPHLLEHLVVDLQVRAESGQWFTLPGAAAEAPPSMADATCDRPIVGTSEWLDEAAGIARIDVSFADDLVALGPCGIPWRFSTNCCAGDAQHTGKGGPRWA